MRGGADRGRTERRDVTLAARDWCGSRAATFRMGSDAHYPEEAPAHRGRGRRRSGSTARPVTNAAVRRVRRGDRLRHRRRAAARPGRLPRRAGRRTSCPARWCSRGRPGPVDLRHLEPVVGVDAGRLLAAPGGPGQRRSTARADHPSSTSPTRTPRPTPPGPGRRCRPRPSGSTPPAAGSTARAYVWGDEPERAGRAAGELLARRLPVARRRRATGRTSPVGSFPPNGYGLLRHGRQRVGVDDRLVAERATPTTPTACCVPRNPRGGDRGGSLDPRAAAVPRSRAR